MAIIIPPPPTKAEQNDRVWTDWFVRLQQILSSTDGIAWALVDKTGSALSDLASRDHSQLTSILGTGQYHVSLAEGLVLTDIETDGHQGLANILGTGNNHISDAEATVLTDIEADGHQGLTNINGTGNYHITSAEATAVTELETRGVLFMISDAADPDATDLAANEWAIWKNTTSGEVRLWVNDGGTLKKTAVLT